MIVGSLMNETRTLAWGIKLGDGAIYSCTECPWIISMNQENIAAARKLFSEHTCQGHFPSK